MLQRIFPLVRKHFGYRHFRYMTLKDWAVWPLWVLPAVMAAYVMMAVYAIGALMVPAVVLAFMSHTSGGAELWAAYDDLTRGPAIAIGMPNLLMLVAIPLGIWFAKPLHPRLARRFRRAEMLAMERGELM